MDIGIGDIDQEKGNRHLGIGDIDLEKGNMDIGIGDIDLEKRKCGYRNRWSRSRKRK